MDCQRRGTSFRIALPAALVALVGILFTAGAVASPLPTLIRDALASHPSLRAKAEMNEAAAAGVDGARWQYYPVPSINTEYVDADATDIDYAGDDQVTTLRLQQPLWAGGRIRGGVKKARAGEELARAEFDAARQDLAQRVVQDYGEALAAHLKTLALERSVATHGNLLERVQRRAGEGVSPESDIVMARSRLETTTADLAVARSQRDAALMRLQLSAGREVSVAMLDEDANANSGVGVGADAAPQLPQEDVEALVERAQKSSPQLARVRAQAALVKTEVKLARASVWPEIYLRAEHQRGSYSIANADPANRVFVGMNAQFGGGLSSLSAAAAASARARASEQDILGVQLDIAAQVRSQASIARSATERRRALGNALQAAVELSDAWDRQFLAGRKPWQEVMNAAREIAQTETQLADAIGSESVARWRLALFVRGVDAVLVTPDVNPATLADPTPAPTLQAVPVP